MEESRTGREEMQRVASFGAVGGRLLAPDRQEVARRIVTETTSDWTPRFLP
jgi:hypothetical protein